MSPFLQERARPRVAFVTHSAAPSGAELFVARVTARCRDLEPVVVLGEHGPLERTLREAGVAHVVVPVGRSVREHATTDRDRLLVKAAETLRASARLARLFRALDVDVVTTHSAKAHVYGALAGRLAGCRVVAHAHDSLTGSRGDVAVLRAALRLLPHHLVTNSGATRASLGDLGPRAEVVPCPAVVGDPPPVSQEAPVTFTMVGRLTAWKGQADAVHAFARARSRGLAATSRLRFVGAALFGTDAEYEASVRALARDLRVDDAVEFVGQVDDVAAELGHVVVHASRRPEPFGQVVVEGMAAGRAVVATRGGGPSEVVTPGEDGLLVPPGDPEALADAMLSLGTDADLRRHLGENARRTARRYSPEVVVPELERAYLRPLTS